MFIGAGVVFLIRSTDIVHPWMDPWMGVDVTKDIHWQILSLINPLSCRNYYECYGGSSQEESGFKSLLCYSLWLLRDRSHGISFLLVSV